MDVQQFAHDDEAAGGNAAGRSAMECGERRVSLGEADRAALLLSPVSPDQDFQDPIGNDPRDVSEAHARAMLLADRIMMFSGFRRPGARFPTMDGKGYGCEPESVYDRTIPGAFSTGKMEVHRGRRRAPIDSRSRFDPDREHTGAAAGEARRNRLAPIGAP